ncbi:MAG: VacJ family lipoprotein [Verrucomicrobia bacterium]|jgi:phospholipid-binding lipoprotein MlaA|nr:VacJ family lipoprotein [Verrucomicrobiota bacterium]
MKNYRFKKNSLALALAFLALFGCLSAEEAYLSEDDFYYESVDAGIEVSDPLEWLNRHTFEFNDFLYRNVMDPIAATYTTITPDTVELAANNFFDNLRYPVRLTGNLLQGRWKGAWVETGRFAINSTAGIAGLMTPADDVESLARINPEDIGQAFGAWGVGEGPFLILPLLGPSNARDFGGLIADRSVNPLKEPFSLISDWGWERELALDATDFITSSPDALEQYRQLKGQAIDPYSSLKNGYTQFRRNAVEE